MERKLSLPECLNNLVASNPSDDVVADSVRSIKKYQPEDAQAAAQLAKILASSGATIPPIGDLVADVASTGGPSSLSTLLSPLYLCIGGAIVPKLGVPGRPSGGIDCLAQVPGFRTELLREEVLSILQDGGYAHFLAGTELAPLDARMFAVRQKIGAQQVPTLVAASLLAKKLAVGITHVGLDIRVANHGNFGSDWETAKRNAHLFSDSAKFLEIEAFPILTDARHPYQPYLGRQESLVALHDIFSGVASKWLNNHNVTCRNLAVACLPESNRQTVVSATKKDLEDQFKKNLNLQGASYAAFEEVTDKTRANHNVEIVAKNAGFVHFPLGIIRDTIVKFQSFTVSKNIPFPDPVGLIMKKQSGEWVDRGAILATLRAENDFVSEASEKIGALICYPARLPNGPGMEGVNG